MESSSCNSCILILSQYNKAAPENKGRGGLLFLSFYATQKINSSNTMKHLQIKIPVILFLAFLMFAGCIKDDISECPPKENVIIRFRYERGTGQDLFGQHITNTGVTVFTATGNFVTECLLEQSDLTTFQGVRLLLEPGDYRLVCWGNLYEQSIMDIRATLDHSAILHTYREMGNSQTDDPLYYAPLIADISDPDASAFLFTVPEKGVVDKTIDFTAAHKTLRIFVKGYMEQGAEPVHCPQIEVTDLASAYDFRMQTYTDFPIHFTQRATTTSDPEIAVSVFHTALFENDNPIFINIKQALYGSTVWSVNLRQFLVDNKIVLTPGDHDQIDILVEFRKIGVTVTIPNWQETPVIPEFD